MEMTDIFICLFLTGIPLIYAWLCNDVYVTVELMNKSRKTMILDDSSRPLMSAYLFTRDLN